MEINGSYVYVNVEIEGDVYVDVDCFIYLHLLRE